ncbi:MAG: hypothetical protein CMH97_08280 [Oceanospirillaceae bacterium]|nr:hypothetical protein [Oceanospirillaceae bacterium]OUX65779.1 MAG: hypothetical protein CBE36_04590 [Oceanospirillaceae bacterium TMED276]|tara:strand:- start:566 stop:1792 length:1227 start_codon:yes stop_codon:yes gene_type:complete
MNNSFIFRAGILAFSVSLVACGGGSGGSSNTAQEPSDNTPSDNTDNTDNTDTPVVLSDTTWSAGTDRVLGLGFNGNSETPEITMMKGAPVSGQDGDVFSIRSVTYPATELSEIKNIDNPTDSRDFQDMDVISHNNESYVVACQDGSDTPGYTSAVSLHIYKTSDTSKVAEIDLVDGSVEARECSEISAGFTQGTNDAMGAVVYYAGATMTTSGSAQYRYARVMKVEFTIDTTADVDATDAVVMDDISTVTRASEVNDLMSGVTGFGDHVYYTYYDDSEETNNLMYANSGSSPATVRNVDWSANDPFVTGVAQQMLVKDMFVIPGQETTDFDSIYMVSDSAASGIVVAGYRRDMNLKQAMTLSSDTSVQNCSDVITGISDQGVGQKLWCHDATDSGNIIEVYSPVHPGN